MQTVWTQIRPHIIQIVWTQIRPNITFGMIWALTVWRSNGIPAICFGNSWLTTKRHAKLFPSKSIIKHESNCPVKGRGRCFGFVYSFIKFKNFSAETAAFPHRYICHHWSPRKTSNEPRHKISNNRVCGTSKTSDQPAHTRSLIRALASRLNILWLLSYWLNHIWSFNAA